MTNMPPLPPAIEAPCHEFDSRSSGRVSYYVDDTADTGEQHPLLLLHSINAAPSAREMRPLFDHYRGQRSVYAPDLPGFGRSERADREYSPGFYADFINEFRSEVIGRPVDIVAFSLSAEFAARAINERPGDVRSLALISPSGFSARRPPTGPATDRILRAVRLPVFGDSVYSMLTSRMSIRYFLKQSFDGEVPQALIDYAYATSHQPGAKYAPFRFLAMKLFSADAFDAYYRPLELPVLVIHDKDPNISFERLEELLDRPNWERVLITPTRGLPHWERPKETIAALDRFWKTVG
jgi:pimeloyl-ACP methyl ester carboxylesterase